MKKSEPQFTDTTYRKYQNSNYEKTSDGWVKKVEQPQETPQQSVKKEYTDEELAEYAKKACDEALRKASSGRDERMRITAKKELLRRKNEGIPEPEKSDNPFDEGLEKGWFDESPTKAVLGKEYINKGQGWELLEKGRKAEIGEVRTWSGEKYQRTAEGWKYLGKTSGGSGTKEEDKESTVYDKPWPKEVDKLTNRSDYEDIYSAAEKAAEEKFAQRYPDEEVFYAKAIKEDNEYSWRKTYADLKTDEEKQAWKKEKKEQELRYYRNEILGLNRYRGPRPSKTTQIANIKSVYQGIADKKAREAKEKSYAEYIATNEGKSRIAELSQKIEENIKQYESTREAATTAVVEAFNQAEIPGLSAEDKNSLVWTVSGDRISARGLSPHSWDDIEIRYDRDWGTDEEKKKYSVSIAGKSRAEPGTSEAKVLMAQLAFLTNETLIEQAKKTMTEIDKVQAQMRELSGQLKKDYSDLDFGSIFRTVGERLD